MTHQQTQKKTDLRSIETQSTRTSPFQNEHTIRDFTFKIDEPEKLGGSNEALTPMEYIIGSLNGCFMIVVEMVAREKELTILNLDASSTGAIDRRGLLGTADVNPHFQTLTLQVDVAFAEEIDEEDFIQRVQKRCPAYNLFKDSGVEIEVVWNISKEAQT
ncbi:osmotically inducible protein OsmC [Alteribacter lacisalsi]|uniref:Osmotically inducible protein OsmC n=1 Tax=Alteribacter lacisalsi TaxID=2045244 RepID=A0A2W0H5G1_9BACI|nr:OsmC family protein [Alteribacter lacisalsi]PYZ96367.1 osmotically inducible protein OsmC [Alteribacter lacisalsi]